MKNTRENLINKITEKIAYSVGTASIKLSENAMGYCCWGAVYETKIPIELLKEKADK